MRNRFALIELLATAAAAVSDFGAFVSVNVALAPLIVYVPFRVITHQKCTHAKCDVYFSKLAASKSAPWRAGNQGVMGVSNVNNWTCLDVRY